MKSLSNGLWTSFKIDQERMAYIYSELFVYLYQRCRCTRCGLHFDVDKAVAMLDQWPGSTLVQKERNFLFFMFGKFKEDMIGTAMLIRDFQFDIGMGADYCINKLYQSLRDTFKQEILESKQCNPKMN